MALWILRPIDKNAEPWMRGYAWCFGMVVRAKTEQDARKLAHGNGGSENKRQSPWLDPDYTTCQSLSASGPAEVVLQDCRER